MSAVTDILLAADVRPFAIAAAIMATLGGLEVLTMIVGFSISELIGSDFALEVEHHDSAIGGLFLRPRMAAWMLLYMLLRSAMLLTVTPPEARYTLEYFPMLFVLGGITIGRIFSRTPRLQEAP